MRNATSRHCIAVVCGLFSTGLPEMPMLSELKIN